MKLFLNRTECNPNGIFSTLSDEDGHILFYTLEHSYQKPDGTYKPKIYDGTFTCKRGFFPKHKETFEVTNVKGHFAILFHVGNYNKDSEGCILVGKIRSGDAVLSSRQAFKEFMALTAGLDQFELVVETK